MELCDTKEMKWNFLYCLIKEYILYCIYYESFLINVFGQFQNHSK